MTDKLNILVVEDDAALRDAVCFTLEMARHEVTGVDGGPAALRALDRVNFSLVVTDLRMQPMDGLQLLREIRLRDRDLPVLLMTAYGDVEKAVAAMRGGACDFLMKPFEPDVLLASVRRYAMAAPAAEDMIAADPQTLQVLALAGRVADTDATVLLTGESGTGKEVFARYIHDRSPRAGGAFVAINCAAIPESLLEATLFGYEKGAFTGAQSAQAGKFEQAQDGTLLLDEISEMPLALQAKLLRVLQEREVERVGGKKPVALNIRVLATSNRDMVREVAGGRFREDLYYRLNVFPIAIPALRERPGDIVPLARYFLVSQAKQLKRNMRFAPEAEARLAGYAWPGNVRELENAVYRAAILSGADVVLPETIELCLPHLPPSTRPVVPAVSAAGSEVGEVPLHRPVGDAMRTAERAGIGSGNMKDLEREHILATLREFGGSRKKTVEKLGISERTLRYKLQQYRDEGYDV